MLKELKEASYMLVKGLGYYFTQCSIALIGGTMAGVALGATIGSLAFGAWGMMQTVTSCHAQIEYLGQLLPRLANKPERLGPPTGQP